MARFMKGKGKFFEAIADKEVQDREEEQLQTLKDNIKEIRALLEVIKERQAATRGMVDHVKGSDYNLEAVYERARKWRHSKDVWSREYTPTPEPIEELSVKSGGSHEKSFQEELEEAEAALEEGEAAEAEADEEEGLEDVAEEETGEEAEATEEVADETAEGEEAAADDTAAADETAEATT